MKNTIKRALLPAGRKLRRLRGGVARNQMMAIDLHSQLQRFLGLDERELQPIISHLIVSSETLVDVGANDGFYTLAFLASPAQFVIACEPGPAADDLVTNAAANGHHISNRFRIERRLVGTGASQITLT